VPKTETKAQNNWLDAFLQEAEDLLAEIDEAALTMGEGDTAETIHRIFHAFHTIKGSSGMCGLTAVADFTHHVETLLDKVRSGEIASTPKLADLVLAGCDRVLAIIAAEQSGEVVAAGSSQRLIAQLNAFAGEKTAPFDPTKESDSRAEDASRTTHISGEQVREIRFHPNPELFRRRGNPILVMRDLCASGDCEVTMHTKQTVQRRTPSAKRSHLAPASLRKPTLGKQTTKQKPQFGTEIELESFAVGADSLDKEFSSYR
jgi:two-component system chemotaxis sensor kinase CheA